MPRGRTRHVRGIVLDRTPLGETDLIITLLTADGDQVRAVARAGRRPNGKLTARVELFNELDLLIAKGKSLDVIAEAQLLDAHRNLRGDLERMSAASACCEAAKLTCYQDSADAFLMPLLSRAMLACEQAADQPHLDLVVAAYVEKVLAHHGWRPELSSCVCCGDEAVTWFSASAGGALCSSCAREMAGAEEVARSQLLWLAALVGSTFDELLAAEVQPAMASWLLSSAHIWAATHLDARLKAFEFLLSV